MVPPLPFRQPPRADYVPIPPYSGPVVRHLIYHIWPVKEHGGESWRWNVDMLKNYIEQFDGVRSIGVVTDDRSESLEAVKNYFGDVRIDNWICERNEPAQREGVTFAPLMKTLPRGENDITFYAHAKGVRHKVVNPIPMVWAYVMYRLLLDNPDEIEPLLQGHGIVGNFKRYSDFRLPKHYCWHYSGTYYWFRNCEVFRHKEWADIKTDFFACIEAWPARIFHPDEGYCLFGDNAGNLYSKHDWKKYLPELLARGIEIAL